MSRVARGTGDEVSGPQVGSRCRVVVRRCNLPVWRCSRRPAQWEPSPGWRRPKARCCSPSAEASPSPTKAMPLASIATSCWAGVSTSCAPRPPSPTVSAPSRACSARAFSTAWVPEVPALRASALNDYTIEIPIAELRQYPVLLALDRDGQPLSVRHRGPIWLVYPWSDFPELDDRVHRQRSIWQLVELEVR